MACRYFPLVIKAKPVKIATDAVAHARAHGNDYLIIDTAGRLAIDEEMMQEISDIRAAVEPTEILLVIDAMQGQDAVNVAAAFHERLHITGIVLTKLDGDSRGGALLSLLKAVTGQPIKFVGSGEDIKSTGTILSGTNGFSHPGYGRCVNTDRKSAGNHGC